MQRLNFILLISFLSLSFPAFAATVSSVKGKNVILTLDGDALSRGQKLELFDTNGKKRAIIQISKFNRTKTKALARVLMGRAQKGYTSNSGLKEEVAGTTPASKKKLTYGGFLGLSLDSMEVAHLGASADLSGTGFSIKGGLDFALSDSFQVRAKAGMEMFSASGDGSAPALCDGTIKCEADINYFTMEGLAQYYINRSKYSFWLGAGGAIAHPISDDTNVVDSSSLDTTSALQLGAGMDIKWGTSYIPVEFVYSMLPESDSVKPSYMTFSVGYMF